MAIIDWVVLLFTLLFIVGYGAWKTKGSKNVQDYIRGGNEAKWWTIGLSVMATQASAITFLSTPGQAFHSGMGFVQFYFGLPIAMVIICLVFIPIYHKLKVYTAYEYLEGRFYIKTRTLAAIGRKLPYAIAQCALPLLRGKQSFTRYNFQRYERQLSANSISNRAGIF